MMLANGLDRCRVAVVNARGYPGAVERNRDRRIAREAFRASKHVMIPGHDYAIVLYPGSWQRAERRAQIDGLLRRAHTRGGTGRVDG